MVNYAKRAKQLIQELGLRHFIIYSVNLLKKIWAEKKYLKYIQKMSLATKQLGGLEGEHYFTYWWDKDKFDKITSNERRDCWSKTKDFVYAEIFPDRYNAMFTFINDNFWRILDKKDHVAEMACASGETVLTTAKYAAQVDGFEYSRFMVDKARKEADRLGISNVTFTHFDATKQKLEKKYNAITVLGLFTCLLDDNTVEKILKNMADSLYQGGILLLKDSYHETPGKMEMNSIYCYNYHSGYKAVYRSKTSFFHLIEKYGFVLIKESYLARKEETTPFNYCSIISIWKSLS